jgi:hypothetical protein
LGFPGTIFGSAWLFQDREIPVDVPELPSNLAHPHGHINGIAARDVGRCIAGALAVARRGYDHDLAGDPRTGKHHPRAIALSNRENKTHQTSNIEQADRPTVQDKTMAEAPPKEMGNNNDVKTTSSSSRPKAYLKMEEEEESVNQSLLQSVHGFSCRTTTRSLMIWMTKIWTRIWTFLKI